MFCLMASQKLCYNCYFNNICLLYIKLWYSMLGNSTRVSEVLILPKRILRTMTFKSSEFSCRDLFKQLNVLTVTNIYILNCVCYVKSHPDEFTLTRDSNSPYNFRLNLNTKAYYVHISKRVISHGF